MGKSLTLKFLLLFFLHLTSFQINAIKNSNEDTIVVEASPPPSMGQRLRHLLVAMTDYYFQPSVVLFRSSNGKLKCITPDGEQGQCTSFKECYPILFSFDEPGKSRHSVLRDDLLATTTPCFSGKNETPTPPKIRQDDDRKEDEIICCTTIPTDFKPSRNSSLMPEDQETDLTSGQLPGEGGIPIPTIPTGPAIWSQNIVGNRPPPFIRQNVTTVEPIVVASNCGVTKVVVSQSMATPPRKAYPWMAALINSRGMNFCGASLIDSLHVLTAQHCTTPYKKPEQVAKLQVFLGSYNVQSASETGRVVRKVSKIYKHSGYSERSYEHDIAILRLDQPVPFTEYIQPLCLNTAKDYDDGKKNATLAGWGRTSNWGGPSPTLRHGTMRIWTNAECQTRYNQYIGFQQIPKIKGTMVCAGNPGNLENPNPVDACQGDSGGPLFLSSEDLPYSQVGIVSWGIGCGQYPGVYTRVNEYLSWIDKNRGLSQASMKRL